MTVSMVERNAAVLAVNARLAAGAATAAAGAWFGAGAAGFLAVPLREILTWVAMGLLFVVSLPTGENGARRCLPAAIAVLFLLAVKGAFGPSCVANVFGVALFTAAVAMGHSGIVRAGLGAVATALAVFGVYRFAIVTIPSAWHLAGLVGRVWGNLAGHVSGEPLLVGMTFGGVDFVALMVFLILAWAPLTPPPRLRRVTWAAVAVILAQTLYLVCLSFTPAVLEALPARPETPPQPQYTPPEWFWADSVRECLPWNVPLLGLALQSFVAAGMFASCRLTGIQPAEATAQRREKPAEGVPAERGPWGASVDHVCVLLALLLPMVMVLSFGTAGLKGKTVVAVGDSMLDWEIPKHGEYGRRSSGGLGMLETYVELLGGTFRKSDTVSEEAFEGADVLLVACPIGDWTEEEKAHVRRYVSEGGSLLVLSTPSRSMADRKSGLHELLLEIGLRARLDVVIPPVELWEHAIAETVHPTAARVRDHRHTPMGYIAASSIDAPWPAVPVVVGRYGWSDPGGEAYWKDAYRFERGERLGDLVLAAEARIGKGRVVLLGDARGFVNQGLSGAYPFTGRLLAYLADGATGPGAWFRQVLGLIGGIILMILLFLRRKAESVAMVSAVFVLSFLISALFVHARGSVLPEEAAGGPARLAYIAASHGEPYSDIPWASEGIDGLKLALMRDGYLPLMLHDFTEERLSKAGILILIGPHRPFSPGERMALRKFVEGGGTAVCMVGSEDIQGIGETLKEDFAIHVAPTPVGPESARAEPDPTGSSFTPYLDLGERRYAQMLLHAGWPVEGLHSDVMTIAGGRRGESVAVARRLGAGYLVVIGDTRFAFNQNLETPTGEPIFGNRANAHFWRWLFGRFADRPDWEPPETPISAPSGEEEDEPAEDTEDDGFAPEKEVRS